MFLFSILVKTPFLIKRPARFAVLILVIALPAFSSIEQNPAPASAAPETPPYSWPRTHSYDVQHYRIALSFDWTKQSVRGETTITLQPFASDVKEIEIDAGDMTIESVRLAGGAPLKYRYVDNEKLYVALDRPYAIGRDVSITIKYAATPKQGMTFISPTETDPSRPYQIWTQGEARTNHYWFPCYDYPNDKATSELLATADEKFQVVSNGALIGVQNDAPARAKTWHWKMDRPFSSYLISIIVGQYEEIKDQFKDKPVISYVYPGQAEDGRVSFGKLAQMVAFYSEKIGYDYPYPKYAQTMVRDFGGAMENISATTMTDNAVHDKRAALDVSSDEIVSHELAHQWFGDLLTCRHWGEIWLNESFAVFFEGLWKEHDKGRDDFLYEMYGNQQGYFRAWDEGNRRPIVTVRYSDPDALFDAYAYPRGGAVLNMLRFVLGEEPFWKAIRHYVKKNQWQNVETSDLVTAIEEATGQNLAWFFEEWVYRMGHPQFEITSSYDGSKSLKLTVKQTQKPDDKRPWFPSPDFFTMPVDIAVTTATGEKTHRVWIDKPEKEFTFEVDSKPLIVNFDRANYLIKQVKFNRSDDEIAYQLLHDSDVMGRVLAAIELKTRTTNAAAKALAEASVRDNFWGVRIEATKGLSAFKNDSLRAALMEAVKDKDSRIRREAIKGLAAYKDPKLADLFIKIINTDPSYFAIAEAARAIGQSGSPQAYEVLSKALALESWQGTIRAGVLGGIAALKDPRAIAVGLKYATPANPSSLRSVAFEILAEAGKGNDRVLETFLSALKEKSLQARFAAVQGLAKLGDQRAIPALEELGKGSDLPAFGKQIITAAINQIRSSKKEDKKD
jgi:aminopeptidase N